MDAADIGVDYLSGADGTWGNVLYGILEKRGASYWVPLYLLE